MLLGVPLLVLSFFKGRVFCWRICPVGFVTETAGRINPAGKTLIRRIPSLNKAVLLVIAVTAAITGIINYLLFPNVALCGASGVVFAFIILSSVTSVRTGEIPLTFILVAIIFLGQQVIQGVFATDNISNLSHFAGGVIGGAAGFGLGRDRTAA
jgi:membrane associated rhomboid family serine protease